MDVRPSSERHRDGGDVRALREVEGDVSRHRVAAGHSVALVQSVETDAEVLKGLLEHR